MQQMTDTRLTHSQIQCAMTCPRKHYIQYILALRPGTEAKPLRIGSAFHLGLEYWTQGGEVEDAMLKGMQAFDKNVYGAQLTDEQYFEYLVDREVLWQLLQGHFWRWVDDNANLKFLASEMGFEIPIVNPDSGRANRNYTLAGKIDAVVQIGDQVAVMEHKTTSKDLSPEADYWQRLRIDQQISIYYLAGQKLGYKPDLIYYNVVRKPGLEPSQLPLVDENGVKIVFNANGERVKTKDGKKYRETADKEQGYILQTRQETPEEYGTRVHNDMRNRCDFYFARKEIPRTQIQMDDAQQDLWQMTQVIRDCDRAGRWPRNTGACVGFGKCPYFLLCTNGWNVESQDVPEGFMRVENVHQELED